jgi:cellulose biosynthesis protein BcsQ
MGEIISFYSYKGGSGRSMALANTATHTAARLSDKKILMIDWDLEAPGLEHYFKPWLEQYDPVQQGGIFEFIAESQAVLNDNPQADLAPLLEHIHRFLMPVSMPGGNNNLFLIRAGSSTPDYAQRINAFDWSAFFRLRPDFFTELALYLSEQFDYVLVDSRTGHTDIGGICTMLLPEKLVLVFTPNEQGLDGVLRLAQKAADYRIESADLRPLLIYPLPSRVDLEEEKLLQEWKFSYQKRFEELFRHIYALPSSISLEKYFNTVQIRHASRYAYGEKLAVVEESNGINSLSSNYRAFATQLTEISTIWEDKPFEGLTSPYQVFFLFAKSERSNVAAFMKNIRSLARQKVILLAHNEHKLLAVEELDDVHRRKIGAGQVDVLVLFLSKKLMAQQDKWMFYLSENLSRSNGLSKYKVVPILLDATESPEILKDIPILPSRRRSVADSGNPDETWYKIASDFRTRLLMYKEVSAQHEQHA